MHAGTRHIGCGSGPRGFTLLELMLALVIMAMVLTMVYSAFSASSRACRFGVERAQIFHTARIAMQDILQSIENIDFGTNDGYRLIGTSGSGRTGHAGRRGAAPCDEIEFASFTAPRRIDNRWFAGQSRVRYTVNPNGHDEYGQPLGPVLEKWVTNLDDLDFKDAFVTELSRDVVGLECTYYDDDDKDYSEWDSDAEDKLPNMIVVTLYVYENANHQVHPLRSAAMIPAMKTTLQTKRPGRSSEGGAITEPGDGDDGGRPGAPGQPGRVTRPGVQPRQRTSPPGQGGGGRDGGGGRRNR